MTYYIGHATKDYDHKAGDSSGNEVKKSKFTYSTSPTSPCNWTYVFRPKDSAKAEKAASMAEKGIANNNIGYCKSGETAYGKDKAMSKLAKEVKYDLSKIKIKCGCSCGDFVCLCNHYAGLTTCYIGSGLGLSKYLKKDKNFETIHYEKGMKLYRGDVLITAHSNGKNNHVVMVLVGEKREDIKLTTEKVLDTSNRQGVPTPKRPYIGTFPTLPKRGWFQKGDKGVQVKNLQKLLVWLGYSIGKAGVDGEYGKDTASAVLQFEKDYKLKYKDGEWGKECNNKARTVKR